jgi:hypothetical protein
LKYKLSEQEINVVKFICSSFDECKKYLESNKFAKDYQFVKTLLDKDNIANTKKLLDEFKKKEYKDIEKILKMYYFITKDKKILKIIDNLSININKTLIFNNII